MAILRPSLIDLTSRRTPSQNAAMNEIVAHPIGPVLWQGAAYGMMISEVRNACPDTVPSHDPQKLNDGSYSLLTIPNIEIAEHDYAVQFYFNDDRLTQVTIATNGDPDINTFRSVAVALRAKYGPELAYRETEDSFSTADWIASNGVNISIACHEVYGLLNINFQLQVATAASKL